MDDLNKGIELQTRAIGLSPQNGEEAHNQLNKLGMLYFRRFQRLGMLDDISQAIMIQQQAVLNTPTGHNQLPSRLNNLGISHKQRFQVLEQLEDINQAIDCQAQAVSLTSESHEDIISRLNNLGISYLSRYQRIGDLADINTAIGHLYKAFSLTPKVHSSLPGQLVNLGNLHLARYQHLGELDDLERSIERYSEAISYTPIHHSGHPNQLNSLGAAYQSRFHYLGEVDDLNKSIESYSQAVSLTEEGNTEFPSRLSNLGAALLARFERLGQTIDIDHAIECHMRALYLSPTNHAGVPNMLNNLAISHHTRFNHFGALEDIEKAIEHQSRTILLSPEDHADLPGRLNNLGALHASRFERLGELMDLENAIEYQMRALSLTPSNHADFPGRLANLGNSHKSRFHESGLVEDLEQAIKYLSRAVLLTPVNHANLPDYVNNLGCAHKHRYELYERREDIEYAIKYHTQAISLIPQDHGSLPRILADTGSSYLTQFYRCTEREPIECAVKCLSQAVALTPDGHPCLSSRLGQLGVSHWAKYEGLRDHQSLVKSLESLGLAARSLTGNPRDRFDAASTLAKISLSLGLPDTLNAYQTGMSIIPHLIWLGTNLSQRYEQVRRLGGFMAEATAAAISAQNLALALEWLEQGRSIVWNQMLQLRSPLDDLRAHYPELASKFEQVARQLHSASSQTLASSIAQQDPLSIEMAAQHRRRLATTYEGLVSEARTIPGFEEFLRPKRGEQLMAAAQSGPVVIINVHSSRCDALILKPSECKIYHVPLQTLSPIKVNRMHDQLENLLHFSNGSFRGWKSLHSTGIGDFKELLHSLWVDIVKPVLDFLGYREPISVDTPRMTWCTTGRMSFLPLHAAGCYDHPNTRVFDYVISSYTPTLSALVASSWVPSRSEASIAAIGLEKTPGHSPLPGVRSELACIKEHANKSVMVTQLVGPDATRSAVLDAMEHHNWVHIACHAAQKIDRPAESGLFLFDGVLDITSIARRPLINKGLAFLSACQTATGDTSLPDEAMTLASAMLTAGYRSVVATMWSIQDEDATIIADKVYSELLRDKELDPSGAAQALHHAVGKLRELVGIEDFARWVPYVHIGI
ncbi:DNA mismatch repair protein MSH3 [Rhizoctonia solani]|uniref:DNA mismatch repair protein MSH3 n=1 Tax=Rhizoctonia solani TaxID=456999 RepID=A0A0K6FPV1_9AGAM|nr:DNA mismatch repair protein MSH3 [Rhizoctonia solani]